MTRKQVILYFKSNHCFSLPYFNLKFIIKFIIDFLIQTLYGHAQRVAVLTVLQDGNLVSGSSDNTIKIWNPTSGELIQTLTGHTDEVKH